MKSPQLAAALWVALTVACGSSRFQGASSSSNASSAPASGAGGETSAQPSPPRPSESSEGLEGYLVDPASFVVDGTGEDGAVKTIHGKIAGFGATMPPLGAFWITPAALKAAAAHAAEARVEVEAHGAGIGTPTSDGTFTLAVAGTPPEAGSALVVTLDYTPDRVVLGASASGSPRAAVSALRDGNGMATLAAAGLPELGQTLTGATAAGITLRAMRGPGHARLSLFAGGEAATLAGFVAIDLVTSIGGSEAPACSADATVHGVIALPGGTFVDQLSGIEEVVHYRACARRSDGTLEGGPTLDLAP